MYWQSENYRLKGLAEQQLLADLTSVWKNARLDEKFPLSLKPLMVFDQKVVAIPFSYYHWGMFYNKLLFKELNLSAPTSAQQLLDNCKTLLANNVIPLGLVLKETWPVFAWFTYLTLRTQGLDFYNQLLKGEISWRDPRVVSVMNSWFTPQQHCPYTDNITEYDWQLPSTSLFRKQIGMMLNGSVIMQLFDENRAKHIGFFPFPGFEKSHNTENKPLSAEIAQVEVWVVPARSQNINIAKKFLENFTQEQTLTKFNATIDYLSPHLGSPEPADEIMRHGSELLAEASGLTSFFDRDAPPEIVQLAESVFTQFLIDSQIESGLEQLESQRLAYYDITLNETTPIYP